MEYVTYTTGLVTIANPVVVLEERVENTANTERGLDNVGGVLAGVDSVLLPLNGEHVLANLNLALTNTGNVNDDLAVGLELLGELGKLILRKSEESSLNGLGILPEGRAELLAVDHGLPLLNDLGGLEVLTHNEGRTGLLGVHSQIVGTTVSAANALNPAGRGKKLGIPAVASIVSHLVAHVLTEADLGLIDTDLLEEEVDASKEVAEGLVVDNLLLDSLANGHLGDSGLARELDVAVEKGELDVSDFMEPLVLLVAGGVNEVLDLGHQELADTEKTTAGGNLVTVRLANGGRGEGHVAGVVLEELGEVEELALGGLGAQVAGKVAAGTNGSLEHEVEGHGRLRLDTGVGVPHVVLLDELSELLAVVVVDLGEDLLVLLDDGVLELDGLGTLGLLLLALGVDLLLLHLLAASLLIALEAGLENVLDEVVGAQNIAVLGVLAHPVGELVDVAGGLENIVGGQGGAVNLEHVLLEDEVLAPDVDDVGLKGAAGRAIVVEAGNTAVDVERGRKEHAATEHGLQDGLVEGLALEGGGRGGHLGGVSLLFDGNVEAVVRGRKRERSERSRRDSRDGRRGPSSSTGDSSGGYQQSRGFQGLTSSRSTEGGETGKRSHELVLLQCSKEPTISESRSPTVGFVEAFSNTFYQSRDDFFLGRRHGGAGTNSDKPRDSGPDSRRQWARGT